MNKPVKAPFQPDFSKPDFEKKILKRIHVQSELDFARSLYTAGTFNTLPLEIYGMTTNVTTPVLYALGTVTTVVSFAVMGLTLAVGWVLQRRGRGRA